MVLFPGPEDGEHAFDLQMTWAYNTNLRPKAKIGTWSFTYAGGSEILSAWSTWWVYPGLVMDVNWEGSVRYPCLVAAFG